MSSITGGRLYSGICGGSSAAGGGALLALDVTSVDADVHSFDELAGLVSSTSTTSSEHHPSPLSRTERGEGSSPTSLSSFAMMMIVHHDQRRGDSPLFSSPSRQSKAITALTT
jgi:hypothetical protein